MYPCRHNSFFYHDETVSRLSVSFAGMYRVIILSTFCVLMAGCTTTNLDSSYLPNSEDAIIVLGVDGAVKVSITPGRSNEETWHFVAGFSNRPTVSVRDGFVVVRLDQTSGRQRYGVYQVDLGGIGLQGRNITVLPTGGVVMLESQTIPYGKAIATFPAEAGTVTYVGTLVFEIINNQTTSVVIKSKWDPDSAKKYMSKSYPKLAPQLRCQQVIDFKKNGLERYW